MEKPEQPLRIRKPKQHIGKFNNPFRKSKQFLRKYKQLLRKRQLLRKLSKFTQPFLKSKEPLSKSKEPLRKSRLRKMCKYLPLREYLFLRRYEFLGKYSKYRIRIRKQFFRNRRFFIRSRHQIHYKNMNVIGRFIGYQGKIIPRRVTKLTLRQQRLMTTAIKKARILCFLPFLLNERYLEKVRREKLRRIEILKRRKNQKRSRKTYPKTEPRTINPKIEPGKSHPKNEPGKTRLKTEPRTIRCKT